MKYLIFLFIALASLYTTKSSAQTWDEVFNQKKTQKRYLVEQIAALQMYAGYAQKGYQIASDGWSTVHGLASGELSLHNAFFGALKTASVLVTKDPRVGEIIGFQQTITAAFKNVGVSSTSVESATYVALVKANLLKHCADDLYELTLLISSGRTELDEVDRLQRLDAVHNSMHEKAVFARWFTEQVKTLNILKIRESIGHHNLQSLYENP